MSFNRHSCFYLPFCFCLLAGIGVWICYAVGVTYQHLTVPQRWPYVSDVGTKPPESCIFALVLNWSAMALAIAATVFHRHLKYCDIETTLNKAALGFGYIAAVGISITGCFQWTEVVIVHVIGAVASFLGGFIYSWLLVAISRRFLIQKLYPDWLVWTRTVIAAMQALFIVLFGVLFFLRNISDAIFSASTASEWCLFFLQLLFYSSLSYDFNHIKKFHCKLTLVDVLNVAVVAQTSTANNNKRSGSVSVVQV